MEAKNCAKCGKWYSTLKSIPICPACEKLEEELFKSVKDYINENPNSTAAEISAATGVSVKKIIKYLKDGRLEVTKGMKNEISCDACGKPIEKGRYCDSCLIKINQEVNELFDKAPSSRSEDKDKSKSKFFTADARVKFKKKL